MGKRPAARKRLKVNRKNTRLTANRHFKRKPTVVDPALADSWDKKATLLQNYARLGLAASVNTETGGREPEFAQLDGEYSEQNEAVDVSKLTDEQVSKMIGPGQALIERDADGNVTKMIMGQEVEYEDYEAAPVKAKTPFVKRLESMSGNVVRKERKMPKGECEFVAKLIEKHKDDYKAMFWDMQLNPYQLTAAQLKKKCEKYLKSM